MFRAVSLPPQNINISVLQGSILGPILFLCYINDLPNATELLTFLFADDTSGLITGDNLPELITKMNVEINTLANWFRTNKMALNLSKTKYIIFHSRGKKLDFDENSIVYNENEIGKPQNPDLITPLREFMTCTPKRTVEPTSFWVCILMRRYPFNIMLIPSVTNSLELFFASTELNISWILNH